MCVKQWDLGHADLLNLFNVPSLVDHRNYLSLGTMCKVVNEPVYFPNDVFVPRTTTLRSPSTLLYYQPFAHTISFLHSFVSKTCSSWSNLPIYITHAKTLSVLILSHLLLIIYIYIYHVNSK